MKFNEQLRKARENKGLTQQQVADALGIDKTTYSGYETGKREPDVAKIKALSVLLEISPDILLGIEQKKTSAEAEGTYLTKKALEVARAYQTADPHIKDIVCVTLGLGLDKSAPASNGAAG